MPIFKFAVTETRNFEMHYAVEADLLDEARDKAAIGDTTFEAELGCTGVFDRFVAREISNGQ